MKSLMILVVLMVQGFAAQAASVPAIITSTATTAVHHSVQSMRENVGAIYVQNIDKPMKAKLINVEFHSLKSALRSCNAIRGLEVCKTGAEEAAKTVENDIQSGKLNKQTGYTVLDILKTAQSEVFEGNGVER